MSCSVVLEHGRLRPCRQPTNGAVVVPRPCKPSREARRSVGYMPLTRQKAHLAIAMGTLGPRPSAGKVHETRASSSGRKGRALVEGHHHVELRALHLHGSLRGEPMRRPSIVTEGHPASASCAGRPGPDLKAAGIGEDGPVVANSLQKSALCPAMMSSPGRSIRWKVLPRMICAPAASRSRASAPPCRGAYGTKLGSQPPQTRCKRPARARPSRQQLKLHTPSFGTGAARAASHRHRKRTDSLRHGRPISSRTASIRQRHEHQ